MLLSPRVDTEMSPESSNSPFDSDSKELPVEDIEISPFLIPKAGTTNPVNEY